MAAIKGHAGRLRRYKEEGRNQYRTPKESGGKTDRYKMKRRQTGTDAKQGSGTGSSGRKGNRAKKELKVRAVLFVEHTPG